MSEVIETAYELHRELRRRGLELRPEVGRDHVLQSELAKRMKLPVDGFSTGLKASGLRAEDYLRHLLAVAQPFAQMFQEIWRYLARHCAPRAGETIRIRFGFREAPDSTEIDLEKFRVMAETSRKVLANQKVALWPPEAAHKLFELSSLLRQTFPNSDYRGYHRGEELNLPDIDTLEEWDSVGQRVRNLLQDAIDCEKDMRAHREEQERSLPELESEEGDENRQDRPPECYRLPLEDLMPVWHAVLKNWRSITSDRKREAKRFFDSQIEPLLESSARQVVGKALQALDILDMPFWRHRWHTYEIWATVVSLQALAEYEPKPVVADGRIQLDGSQPALVARLFGEIPGFVHVQSETVLPSAPGILASLWSRKIKPDLRFGLSDPASHTGTVAIVEFKQRRQLDEKHVLKVMTAYSAGSARGGGVIMINYDTAPTLSQPLSPRCVLLGNVRPGKTNEVEEFKKAVQRALKEGGFPPLPRRKSCVLLDVSGSMGDEYKSSTVQAALRRLMALPYVTILRFNDGLVPGGDLRKDSTLTTAGGTELGSALRQMFSLPELGIPERLLVVTDGGHDHPRAELSKISEVRECSPADLDGNLDWLQTAVIAAKPQGAEKVPQTAPMPPLPRWRK